ncbi:MAG: hypothetical protein ACTHMC_05905 [Pseudobacter sp.]|uniref:hypothetical protein n=1 Tax=Pseudobacter sp. TaxID=2045420 RepID=UPI003F7FA031
MLKETLSLTLISFLICVAGYPQNALPNLLPPSPISEEFKKFDEFKMSPVNGLPDISIPIHVIKVNGMEIPLNLSYHASGIKLKQTSGEVGVGWNLNSNYRISRTIFGRPDEHYTMPSDYDSLGQPAYVRDHYLAQFIGPGGGGQMPYSDTYLDGEYDIFSYGSPTASGLFIIGDRANKVIKPLEFSLSKFSYINTPDSGILSVSSVDPNGNIFDYGRDFASNSRVFENSAGPGTGYKAPTAWPLMKIRTSRGGDEIRFNYYTTLVGSFQGENNLFVAKEAARLSETDYHSFSSPNSEGSPYSTFFTSSIVTKYEKVEFIRRPGTAELIDTIKVRTAAGNVIKYISFFYSAGGNFRFLDSIRIYGSSLQEEPQVYAFNYRNKSQNPNQLITDSWGYCKGGIPGNNYHQEFWDDQLYFRSSPCAGWPAVNLALLRVVMTDGVFNTRDGFDFQDCYSLQKITYPTGGTTEYFYESNKYINRLSVQTEGGGLRIKQIVKKDPVAGNSLIRDYAYGENENGLGSPIVFGGLGFWNYKDVNAKLVYRILGSACGLIDNWTPLVLANEYVYSLYPQGDVTSFISLASGNIRYPSVTEYFSSTAMGLKSGKIIYKYDTPDEVLETGLNVSGSVGYVYSFSPWNKPCLREQMTFSYENGTYTLIKKDSLEYLMAPTLGFQGLKVQNYASDQDNGGYINDPNSPMAYYDAVNSWFKYGTYGISTGLRLLKEKHSFDYTPQGRLKNVEKYEYNAQYQLRSLTKLEQNGEVVVEESKYPGDFPALTGTDPISKGVKNLLLMNALDEVVEHSIFKQAVNGTNKRLLSSTFKSFYNDNPYLKAIHNFNKVGTITDFTGASVQSGAVVIDNRYKTELLFDKYNSSGKILQMHKQHDYLRSYKWSAENLYPVAEILNAAESQVFFSNMEEKTGWGIAAGISYDQTKSHTGRVSMKIINSSGTKISSHANIWLSDPSANERKYRYSGWVYSEGPTAEIWLLMKSAGEAGYYTLVDNIPIQTTGKWTYVQKEIVVPANISLLNIRIDNNGGGAVWFDDIRLHPANATMSTYTYEPLIGATSISDVNSKPTYYEYDSFGRLSLILDENKNILKKVSYKFNSPL